MTESAHRGRGKKDGEEQQDDDAAEALNCQRSSTHPEFKRFLYERHLERSGIGRDLSGAYITLRTIVGHINTTAGHEKYGCAWISKTTLAEETGYSERQVNNHIAFVQEHAIVDVSKRDDISGNHNLYTLLPLDGIRGLPIRASLSDARSDGDAQATRAADGQTCNAVHVHAPGEEGQTCNAVHVHAPGEEGRTCNVVHVRQTREQEADCMFKQEADCMVNRQPVAGLNRKRIAQEEFNGRGNQKRQNEGSSAEAVCASSDDDDTRSRPFDSKRGSAGADADAARRSSSSSSDDAVSTSCERERDTHELTMNGHRETTCDADVLWHEYGRILKQGRDGYSLYVSVEQRDEDDDGLWAAKLFMRDVLHCQSSQPHALEQRMALLSPLVQTCGRSRFAAFIAAMAAHEGLGEWRDSLRHATEGSRPHKLLLEAFVSWQASGIVCIKARRRQRVAAIITSAETHIADRWSKE